MSPHYNGQVNPDTKPATRNSEMTNTANSQSLSLYARTAFYHENER